MLAMLIGNLIMIVMFIYENSLIWLVNLINKKKHNQPMSESVEMGLNWNNSSGFKFYIYWFLLKLAIFKI